jgi:hypothetical protein
LKSRLLLPIPQLPSTAKDGILPVTTLWRKAALKESISRARPTKSEGLAGKLGSGSIGVNLKKLKIIN